MPKDKKRKRDHVAADARGTSGTGADTSNGLTAEVDTSKPTALFTPHPGGRKSTLSVAIAGSVISNAKSHELKTVLAGTIARALAVFCVDEVVIFDDSPPSQQTPADQIDPSMYTAYDYPCHFLAHLLTYLETPPHLRKTLFGMHPNLRTAGTLPSLDMPHHLRATERCDYREGVTTGPAPSGGTLVDTGLPTPHAIPETIPPGTRVTLHLSSSEPAQVVGPNTPREQGGYYWGFSVRQCSTLSQVFTECPFGDGYDMSFGTSERGAPLASVLASPPFDGTETSKFHYEHMLLVFGGVAGLETAARNDPELAKMGVSGANVGDLFDRWVNVLPGQGSRTIRTEEAVWLGLMGLRGLVEQNER